MKFIIFSVNQSFLSKATNQVTIFDQLNAHATKGTHGELNGFLTLFVLMLYIPVNHFFSHVGAFSCLPGFNQF